MGGPRIEGRILKAAIHLFGNSGFDGVTTRELAHEAHCMEGGIYRIYRTKRNVYEDAIKAVVKGTTASMATFALGLFTEAGATMERDELIKAAVHRWYWSLSTDGAKLIQQVLVSDAKHREQAQECFTNVQAILQKTLTMDSKATQEFDVKTRTEGLISSLFHLKVAYCGPADNERQEVDRHLQDWLSTLPAKDAARYPFRSSAGITDPARSKQRL
jgi:AcrR family transcriptional regulator